MKDYIFPEDHYNELMKSLFTLVLLMAVSTAHAQKKLSQQVFQVNVRPVLSAILNDFYQMMSQFPDFPKELYGIVDQLDAIHVDKELIKEKCPRLLNAACIENVNSLRSRLLTLERKTNELLSEQNLSTSLYMTSLSGIRTIHQFQAILIKLKGELDNSSLMIKAQVSHRRETYRMIKLVDELSTYISLTIVEFIPYKYKEDFRHFYFNFVQPIQLHVSKNKNYEFLNRNFSSLNFTINLLNMNLTKRNKKTPQGMAPYLSIMHNRWNSLLRYYMEGKKKGSPKRPSFFST
jgi:hypothetical protein